MDLMFKRYSDPLTLLNMLIENSKLSEYMRDLEKIISEEDLWEFFLHKIYGDLSWNDFLKQVKETTKRNSKNNLVDIDATINRSRDILMNFNPNDKG